MITIYFDGGSRGNPGNSGCGATLENDDFIINLYLNTGKNTNNHAEYMGLIIALRELKNYPKEFLDIYGDSQLIIKQLKGEYECKAKNLKPFYEEAISILKNYKYKLTHVLRNNNKEADELANIAMDNS